MNDSQPPEKHQDDMLPISDAFGSEGSEFEAPVPQLQGYEILNKIGEAGQGQVWCAIQQSTQRKVAIKVPRLQGLGARKAFRRFEREAQVVARLKHPNIARIYDSGINTGMYYFTMEYIEGRHLDQFVMEGNLTEKQILQLIQRVCLAVHYAHQNAVIHRDLKPSNILVTSDSEPHVVDFGLAKGLAEDDLTVTVSMDDQPAGTPAYMSPEQAGSRSEQIDIRTDIYSIGVILYQLLTGNFPHDLSGGRQTVLNRIANEPIIKPQTACRNIDKELGYILQKALAAEPQRRYSSAQEMATDIQNFLEHKPLTARPESIAYLARKFFQRHRGVVLTATASLVAVVGGLVSTSVLFWQAENARQGLQDALEREERLFYSQVIQTAHSKIKQGQLAGLRTLLEETNPALRNWEWGYLIKHCQFPEWSFDYGSQLGGLGTPLGGAGLSNNRKYLAIQDGQHVITLMDTDQGDILWEKDISGKLKRVGVIYEPVFGPDDDYLLVRGGDSRLFLLAVETGDVLQTIEPVDTDVICFAADRSRIYTGSSGGDVTCYDATSWQAISTIKMDHRIRKITISPQEQLLYVISQYGILTTHDLDTLEKRAHKCTVTGEGIRDLLILPEKNKIVLAAGYGFYFEDIDKSLQQVHAIYDQLAETDQQIRKIKDGMIQIADHTQNVFTMDAAADHCKLITGSHDGTANVYTDTGHLLGTIYHDDAVSHVFFLPHDRVLTVGLRGKICAWSNYTIEQKESDTSINLSDSVGAWAVDYRSDGDMLVMNAWNDQVVLLDTRTEQTFAMEIQGYRQEVQGDRSRPPTLFRPGTSELIIKVQNTIRIHDTGIEGFPEVRRFQTPEEIHTAAMDPLGECIAVCYKDGSIDAISLDNGNCNQIPFDAETLWESQVVFSNDGSAISFLEAGGQRRLITWDRWTGQKISTIETGFHWYSESIAFHPNGKMIAAGDDRGNILLWDIDSKESFHELSKHGPGTIHSLLFTQDGQRLLSGGHDNALRFWDWQIEKNIFTIEQGYYPSDISFSPDGANLASTDGRPVQLRIRKAMPWQE
jgi:WD40 repeat protein/predicted Ser/Thr protein kinase